MRWAEYVTHIWAGREMRTGFRWEIKRKDLEVDL